MSSPPPGRRAHRRWLGLPPRIAFGFGAALLSLAVAAAASFAALRAEESASRLVSHTAEAHFAVDRIESGLLASRAALGAYLSSRDPRDRDRFVRADSEVQQALARLERASLRHPGERPRVGRLAEDLDLLRSEHARMLALGEGDDVEAAQALHARGEGREALRRAMAALDQIRAVEARLHEGREAAWNRSVLVSNAVFAAAVGVLLVLILVAARLVRDEIRAREAEAAARERALLVQQRLMAMVSHDLRNPLSGILTAGWTLQRGGASTDAAALGHRIVAAGRRMERLIRDILDWSRVHGGMSLPLHAREDDLHEVCRRLVDEAPARDASRIRLEREGDTRAVFDPDRMEQVVGNLVANALRHAPAGTPVRVRTVGTPDEVRVEVHDSGPGVPPGLLAELFEPFRQGPGGQGSGVGLGLFIVRTLTEAHRGRIRVDSEPGSTTFAVHLPRRAVQPARESSEASGSSEAPASGSA